MTNSKQSLSVEELAECPFCASDQLDEKTHSQSWDGEEHFQGFVECYDCGARGPQTAWYDDHDGALYWLRKMHNNEGWNTRSRSPLEDNSNG